MLRVLGNPKRLCDGITRRDLLQIGSLGLMGLGANALLPQQVTATDAVPRAVGGFGKAKSCIFLYLYGAPSQLETFDPKPDAPEGIRGEIGGAIDTNVPGLRIAQGLPLLSRVMDKVTILRSVTHQHPIHGVAFATTGIPNILLPMELNPRDANHWPYIGSVVEYVDRLNAAKSGKAEECEVPRNLAMPWAFSSQRIGEVARAGPYGGFLGQMYDPIYTEFVGKGTKKAKKTLTDKVWDDLEPYRGITRDSRFQLSSVTDRGPSLTVDRMNTRRSMLQQLEDLRREIDAGAEETGIDRHRTMAYNLLGSEKFRNAFDLGLESDKIRDLYGMTLFGQASLTARRLVEAGGRFVSVFWDEYGLAGTGWDTHWDHFPRMKDELLPGLDGPLSGLLIDLEARGLLDETLVVCISEHGRTPKIAPGKGGGRDHWSRCYSVVLAGGGIARGNVVGKSDKIASDPAERPISPKDVLATILHQLGIDLDTVLSDRQGRPMPLVPTGEVIREALA